MKKVISVLLAMVMALTICGITAAEQEPRKMEIAADADEFIAVFLGEHPEELEGTWAFSAQMEAVLTQMGGIAGMVKQLSALGTPESVMPAYEGEMSGLKVFHIPCVFSAMQVDLILFVQDGVIAGLQTGAYSGSHEEKTESGLYDSIELALPVPMLGELPGILTVPKGEGPFPVVVLLQGSGASDKDESVGNLKPFRDLAEGLAERGIAVYRFDKRSYVYGMELMTNRQITAPIMPFMVRANPGSSAPNRLISATCSARMDMSAWAKLTHRAAARTRFSSCRFLIRDTETEMILPKANTAKAYTSMPG